jgi:hypothetical protein
VRAITSWKATKQLAWLDTNHTPLTIFVHSGTYRPISIRGPQIKPLCVRVVHGVYEGQPAKYHTIGVHKKPSHLLEMQFPGQTALEKY